MFSNTSMKKIVLIQTYLLYLNRTSDNKTFDHILKLILREEIFAEKTFAVLGVNREIKYHKIRIIVIQCL